ncbi:hypothetical protein KCU96_g30, partial [Aureobasidium melanogenum]
MANSVLSTSCVIEGQVCLLKLHSDDSLVGINEIGVIDPCDVLSIHDEMNRSQIGVRPFPPRRTLLGLFERQREMLRRIPYNHSSRGCRGSTIRGGIRYARGTCERIRDRVTRPQHRYRYEQVFCSSSRCPHDSGGIDGHLLKTALGSGSRPLDIDFVKHLLVEIGQAGRGFSSCRLGRLESCTFSSQQMMQSPVTVEDLGIPDASGIELELPILDSVVDSITLPPLTRTTRSCAEGHCLKRGRVIKGYGTVQSASTVPPFVVRDEQSPFAPPVMYSKERLEKPVNIATSSVKDP